MSVARTPEQIGVVERRNHTLVEVARTMLSAAKVPLDGENLDKIKEKGEACILVGYSNQSRVYRVYNKRTRLIVETIHVFDEFPLMVSDHVSSDPAPQCPTTALEHGSLTPTSQRQVNVPQAAKTVTTSFNKFDMLFSLMFDEYFTGATIVVLKSSAVPTVDASDKRQQSNTTSSTSITIAADLTPLNIQTTPEPTIQVPTQVPSFTAIENNDRVEIQVENIHVNEDELINIFSTPVYKVGEPSSCHIDSSNMPTFY
ncbi:gag-pol polyprotein [Tanacetum coccineum]